MRIIAVTILITVSSIKCDIQLSPQLLSIQVNQEQIFCITARNVTASNLGLYFVVQHEDILSINPPYVVVESSDKTYDFIIKAHSAGRSEISVFAINGSIDMTNLYLSVNIFRHQSLTIIARICGWLYFILWSISYYPQVYGHYKRKSVVGLHFDYLALCFVDYISIITYSFSLFFNPYIQKQYHERFPRGLIPVNINDLVYISHGYFVLAVMIFQCLIYERGDQKISIATKTICGLVGIFGLIGVVLGCVHVLPWLDFLYCCSYIKIIITVIKCCPQAYMNYKRKSTDGWSIECVILSINGGLLSIAEMIFDSYNYGRYLLIFQLLLVAWSLFTCVLDDWISIIGNFSKFGLGLLTVMFYILFAIQHFILYPNKPKQHN